MTTRKTMRAKERQGESREVRRKRTRKRKTKRKRRVKVSDDSAGQLRPSAAVIKVVKTDRLQEGLCDRTMLAVSLCF